VRVSPCQNDGRPLAGLLARAIRSPTRPQMSPRFNSGPRDERCFPLSDTCLRQSVLVANTFDKRARSQCEGPDGARQRRLGVRRPQTQPAHRTEYALTELCFDIPMRVKCSFRKEDRVQQIVVQRGTHPVWSTFSSGWKRAPDTSGGTTTLQARRTSTMTPAGASATNFYFIESSWSFFYLSAGLVVVPSSFQLQRSSSSRTKQTKVPPASDPATTIDAWQRRCADVVVIQG
jgi:hypothetical protein